jgi:hypothetical protein
MYKGVSLLQRDKSLFDITLSRGVHVKCLTDNESNMITLSVGRLLQTKNKLYSANQI